ncbi:hypothetical protein [Sorangium sp. So ce204]|uniref:hypothetical protein n=1 Tax=Sorangium sp. So ce204 TaxID=3133288 RepID=UPI003F5DBA7C
MKVLRVVRIETAPGGTVHLITEAGERVIVRRGKIEGYSTVRIVKVTEEEVADRHILSAEALPKRGAGPAVF